MKINKKLISLAAIPLAAAPVISTVAYASNDDAPERDLTNLQNAYPQWIRDTLDSDGYYPTAPSEAPYVVANGQVAPSLAILVKYKDGDNEFTIPYAVPIAYPDGPAPELPTQDLPETETTISATNGEFAIGKVEFKIPSLEDVVKGGLDASAYQPVVAHPQENEQEHHYTAVPTAHEMPVPSIATHATPEKVTVLPHLVPTLVPAMLTVQENAVPTAMPVMVPNLADDATHPAIAGLGFQTIKENANIPVITDHSKNSEKYDFVRVSDVSTVIDNQGSVVDLEANAIPVVNEEAKYSVTGKGDTTFTYTAADPSSYSNNAPAPVPTATPIAYPDGPAPVAEPFATPIAYPDGPAPVAEPFATPIAYPNGPAPVAEPSATPIAYPNGPAPVANSNNEGSASTILVDVPVAFPSTPSELPIVAPNINDLYGNQEQPGLDSKSTLIPTVTFVNDGESYTQLPTQTESLHITDETNVYLVPNAHQALQINDGEVVITRENEEITRETTFDNRYEAHDLTITQENHLPNQDHYLTHEVHDYTRVTQDNQFSEEVLGNRNDHGSFNDLTITQQIDSVLEQGETFSSFVAAPELVITQVGAGEQPVQEDFEGSYIAQGDLVITQTQSPEITQLPLPAELLQIIDPAPTVMMVPSQSSEEVSVPMLMPNAAPVLQSPEATEQPESHPDTFIPVDSHEIYSHTSGGENHHNTEEHHSAHNVYFSGGHSNHNAHYSGHYYHSSHYSWGGCHHANVYQIYIERLMILRNRQWIRHHHRVTAQRQNVWIQRQRILAQRQHQQQVQSWLQRQRQEQQRLQREELIRRQDQQIREYRERQRREQERQMQIIERRRQEIARQQREAQRRAAEQRQRREQQLRQQREQRARQQREAIRRQQEQERQRQEQIRRQREAQRRQYEQQQRQRLEAQRRQQYAYQQRLAAQRLYQSQRHVSSHHSTRGYSSSRGRRHSSSHRFCH